MDRATWAKAIAVGLSTAVLGAAALWVAAPRVVQERTIRTDACEEYCAAHWEEVAVQEKYEDIASSPFVRGFTKRSCIASCRVCNRPHCFEKFD